MTARLYILDDFRELRAASLRPRRQIGEACVRSGRVIADVPREMDPNQARAWAAHLLLLADAAEAGEEADG